MARLRLSAPPARDELAPWLARLVAVVVTGGFFFGGLIGIVYSDHSAAGRAAAIVLLVTLLGLHLRNCVRRSDGARPRGWVWTLAAQALLTCVPMVWFADTWYGNSGFLAAAVLLLLRPTALAWTGFGLVMVVQGAFGALVRPTVTEVAYLVVGHAAFVGLALYTVARLADVVVALRDARTRLAAAQVARERVAFAETLRDRVGSALAHLVRTGEQALAGGTTRPSHTHLVDSLQTARQALQDARAVAYAHRETPDGSPSRVADDLTTRTVAALGVTVLCLMIVPVGLRLVLRGDHPPGEVALFAVLLAAFTVLFLRNCSVTADGSRPRHWPWTFLGLAVLAVGPVPVFGIVTWEAVLFLPGIALVLLRRWVGLLVAVPFVLLDPVLGLWSDAWLDRAYTAVWTAEHAVLVFGVAHLFRQAIVLRAARVELARTEVTQERLRFARDVHDLLGYGLSAVVLKWELADRLVGRDDSRARAELAEGLAVARRTMADTSSVAEGYRRLSLGTEIESVQALLHVAGIDVTTVTAPTTLPADVDSVLAAVLREGVTNVLRHSEASRCEIHTEVRDGTARLRLGNDGVRPADSDHVPGTGLENLRHRVGAVGGTVTAAADAGSHVLTVEVPLTRGTRSEPTLVARYPDGVDSVAGAQFGDR